MPPSSRDMKSDVRPKRSPIWAMPKEDFRTLVASSKTLSEIVSSFGFATSGGTFNTVKKRIAAEGLDSSHITLGIDSNKGKRFTMEKVPLEEVMTENSTYSRGSLKRRLLKDGIVKDECSVCGQPPFWNGRSLVMVLDHHNGVRNDNRRENLRMLCPNCNSQQDTFGSRNRVKRRPHQLAA